MSTARSNDSKKNKALALKTKNNLENIILTRFYKIHPKEFHKNI